MTDEGGALPGRDRQAAENNLSAVYSAALEAHRAVTALRILLCPEPQLEVLKEQLHKEIDRAVSYRRWGE